MFREMRRSAQQIDLDACLAILDKVTSGVLALCGDDGYPYAVPLSFARVGDCLYFHCATVGHKVDSINRDDKASFCVISDDKVIDEKFTTAYRSVIAFGRVRMVEAADLKRVAINAIMDKYSPAQSREARLNELEKDWNRLGIIELKMEHITGKTGKEFGK